MMDALAILRGLDDADVDWLLAAASILELSKDEHLIATGEFPDSMFFVVDGMVGVFASDTDRRLATLGAGDVIGEMTWLERRAPTESVIALEPVKVLALSHRALDARTSADNAFSNRLYRALATTLSERLRRANLRLAMATDGDAHLARARTWPIIAEALMRWKEAVSRADEAARRNDDRVPDNAAAAIRERFVKVYQLLEAAIGDTSPEDDRTKQEIGLRVQQEMLPFILLTGIGERWLTKPRGYAGDYWTIELMYRNQATGVSRVGPTIDRCLLDAPTTVAVRNRRRLLCDEIQRTVALKGGDGARITSLACGPAEEVFDALQTLGRTAKLSVMLVDFDYQALAFVAEKRDRLQLQRVISPIAENLIHLAVGRTNTDIANQDFIYSIGLIDYFDDELVIKLLDLVHGMLRPGGRVMVGNFHKSNPCKAFMDHVLGWTLKHRDEEDMNRLFSTSRFGRPCTRIQYEDQRINLFAECVSSGQPS